MIYLLISNTNSKVEESRDKSCGAYELEGGEKTTIGFNVEFTPRFTTNVCYYFGVTVEEIVAIPASSLINLSVEDDAHVATTTLDLFAVCQPNHRVGLQPPCPSRSSRTLMLKAEGGSLCCPH